MKQLPTQRPFFFLLVLVLLQYGNTLWNGYVMDDKDMITQNSIVQKGISAAPHVLLHQVNRPGSEITDYRPISYISHMLDYSIWKLNPFGGHLHNLLLFYLCCCLLLVYLRIQFDFLPDWIPLAMLLLFIVHPIHVEVVANIKNRDEMLVFIGGVGCLIAGLRFVNFGKPLWLLIASLAFSFALLSKENTVVFLALLPLAAYFSSIEINKGSLLRLFGLLLPVFLITVLFFVLRIVYAQGMPDHSLFEIDNSILLTEGPFERAATILMVLAQYLKNLVGPWPLVYTTGFDYIPIANFDEPKVWLVIAFILISAVVAIRSWNRNSLFAFGLLFFTISLSVYLHLFPGYVTLADRFLFLPSLGFCVIVGAVLFKADQYLSQNDNPSLTRIGKSLYFAGIAVFCLLTLKRNMDWQSNERLYKADMPYLENCARGHLILANKLLSFTKGKESQTGIEAQQTILHHYSRAEEIYSDLQNDCYPAKTLILFGRVEEAKANLDKLIEKIPESGAANFFAAYIDFQSNNLEEAKLGFQKAIEDKEFKEARKYLFLSRIYFTEEQMDLAIDCLQIGIQAYPEEAALYKDLVLAHFSKGDYKSALTSAETAARIFPRDKQLRKKIEELKKQIE